MSAFIEKKDYENTIRTNVLDQVTNTTDSILDIEEDTAISFVKGYLNARYDVENIFNKTGSDRHPVVLMYCIDIVLYNVHSRINPRKIPELRIERYNRAIEWLDKVNQQIINPPDLPLFTDGERNYILYGSEPKRNNYI